MIGVKVVHSETQEELSVSGDGDCLVDAHAALHDLTEALRINLDGHGLDEGIYLLSSVVIDDGCVATSRFLPRHDPVRSHRL